MTKEKMITKTINKQARSLVDVAITVPWADLEPKWNEILARLGADIEVPGFRKGTAPANLVETQLGSKFQDEVLKATMPEFLIEALKGSDIIPIDYPKYQLTSFAKGQNLQYKATVTNRPTVSVGNYKVIKVGKVPVKDVVEDDVNKVIEDLYSRWKAKGGQLTVNSPQQSDKAQTPSSSGSTPTESGSISFQGTQQPAQVPQQTNGQTEGPDDNFAKAMGVSTLVDLRAKIRKDLEDHNKLNNELDFEEAILQEVEKITTVELPDILIEDELNRMLVSLQRRVADMGLLLDDYLRGQGKTLDQLKNEWKVQAEKNVRMELGLSEIARAENVNITDSDLQSEIDKITDEKVKRQFEIQEPRLHLRHALRQTKTLNLLKTLVAPNG
ncbi:hypothetical protein A2769_03615 [Candidatus Daviesbacteria bacterium RIFCSPHIGHO2_01_FULL_37_27]|nr:MAG: hypothetical protein A2769_03615 [Candidatus Daviesbacteria bacterium RIFCSPHIGHO2_01_FULL_37_27]